jgi:NADPH:quinone reductase-like Zn-dependent oxidoreductase
MQAAVVTTFDAPPACHEIPAPTPSGPHEVVVDVVAAGLHPRVRSQARGSHYTSTADAVPFVPGIDGVCRTADGALRYFLLHDTAAGSMAEQTLVDLRRSVALPSGTDPVQVAAAVNPAMSSWIALRRRFELPTGARVLVLGATGNAGRMAVQIAKRLGAAHVVAAGRRMDRLAGLSGLGADETVQLDAAGGWGPRLGEVAGDVDVVLDYVWGQPAADALTAVVSARADRARPLCWIEVGSVAGPTAPVPSAALRAARLTIIGSGQGSVPTADILDELPELLEEVGRGVLRVDARAVALSEVTGAWRSDGEQRLVITP